MKLNINRRWQKRIINSWEVQEWDRHISGREFTEQEIEYFKSKKPLTEKVIEKITIKKETKQTTKNTLVSKKKK